jgi:hypothetical protein
MAQKKKPLPLHVSLHRIELERNNVAQRTKARIAKSRSKPISYQDENDSEDESKVAGVERHGCLNATFCFCVLLLLFTLLFLQWVHYKYEVTDRTCKCKTNIKIHSICFYHRDVAVVVVVVVRVRVQVEVEVPNLQWFNIGYFLPRAIPFLFAKALRNRYDKWKTLPKLLGFCFTYYFLAMPWQVLLCSRTFAVF